MPATRMIRVSDETLAAFKREAARTGDSLDVVAAAALRALRQKRMGAELAEPLRHDEQEWLDADLG